jgi:hypothetical protein
MSTTFDLDTFHQILLDVKNVHYLIKLYQNVLQKNKSSAMDIIQTSTIGVFP